MSEDEELGSVWITSAPDEAGHYHVAIETDADTSFPMDVTNAYAWAREVLSAVAAAEYDAAVVKQMRIKLDVPQEAIGLIVSEIRADRAAEVPLSMVPGLGMTPGVSAFTGKGFLALSVRGKRVGQWELEDARQHALALLLAIEVAVLDGAYLRALENIGLERNQALNVIDDLINFRDPPLQRP